MNNNNLLIASSPMQIINGIEAIKHFNLETTTLVLILKQNKLNEQKNNEQLDKIAELHNWKKIIKVNQNNFFETTRFISNLKNIEFNYVFIGYFNKINSIIIPNLIKRNLFLVDDGTATINTYKKKIMRNRVNKISFIHLKYLICGFKIKIREQINLFTYFELEQNKKIRIIKNNLNYFKNSRLEESELGNRVIFLGQILVEQNLLALEDYKHYLNSISSMHSEKILYIPHRYEEINKTVRDLGSDKFEILEINLPVELYLIYNKITPKKIISFCTSAFFVLDKIFPEATFEHIAIPESKILKNKEILKDRYKALENESSSKAINLEE